MRDNVQTAAGYNLMHIIYLFVVSISAAVLEIATVAQDVRSLRVHPTFWC